jgi:hypothetical protein
MNHRGGPRYVLSRKQSRRRGVEAWDESTVLGSNRCCKKWKNERRALSFCLPLARITPRRQIKIHYVDLDYYSSSRAYIQSTSLYQQHARPDNVYATPRRLVANNYKYKHECCMLPPSQSHSHRALRDHNAGQHATLIVPSLKTRVATASGVYNAKRCVTMMQNRVSNAVPMP